MTESAKVVEFKQPEKKQRVIKPRIEQVHPTSIVDVWRLVRNSQVNGEQPYPDLTEDAPESIQSHLLVYLQHPTFTGLIARVGKKPVGAILGNINQRAYGRPSRYAFVWCFWVEPGYRKQGIGHALWNEYSSALKKINIFNWEAHTSEALQKGLTREAGVPVQKLMSIVGGRI